MDFTSTDLEIQCPDVNGECTWFRIENGSQVSVESRFLNLSNNNIELQRNDWYGFGLYNVSTSQSDSFCYKVCPVNSGRGKCVYLQHPPCWLSIYILHAYVYYI